MARAVMPFTTLAYGSDPAQVGDLRLPPGDGPHPVAVLIHGGFWRDHWTRDLMDAMAVDLTQRGFATWNLEYRRVGSGGGWPATLEDVGAGLDHLTELVASHDLNLDRVVVIGHSAGGHLAHWAAGRASLGRHAPGAEPKVRPTRTIGLAPVFDLADAHGRDLGDGAVEGFLRREPGHERYHMASPAEMGELAGSQVIIHGTADDAVPIDASRATGIPLIELADVDHFAVIDPEHEAWPTIVEAITG